ncbi:tape measure protein [Entomomonas sp. E2T0]|uniref:tape measure protein n=1 Tax=Entomomonas sp. E2T0 TaxID=2930213 RepID=UPI002228400E|nr:tape measure protein [Entomomonas sp. E2T0]UYZ84282.1 tape measure protein [Entomomonas sp. E2T0]
MSRDLEFAIRFKTDVNNAKADIQKKVIDSLKGVGDAVKQANSSQQQANEQTASSTKKLNDAIKQTTSTVENANSAQKKSVEVHNELQQTLEKQVKTENQAAQAAEQTAKSLETVNNRLSQVSSNWQQTTAAQNAAMRTYHAAAQAAEQQAAAEAAQVETAKKTTAENEKKQTSLQKLLGAIDKTQKALNDLDKQEQELIKHFREGRIDIDAFNNAMAKIQQKRNALSGVASDAKKSTNEVNKLTKAVRSLSGLLATAVTGYSLVNLGKSVIETNLNWQKTQNILTSATGSASEAAKQLDYVRTVSSKLNTELLSTANSYSKLYAAAKDTPAIANELQHIFESINEVGTTLQLAPSDMTSILTNFERMISTGKVQLTDLQQLANYIPGTFDKAAQALGTNTKQLSEWIKKGLVPASEFLPRFADQLHNAFGSSAQTAADGLQGQLTSLTNVWTELKLEAGNAGFIDSFTEAVKALRDVLQDPAVREGLNTLIQALGQVAKTTVQGVGNVTNVTRFLAEEIASITGGIAPDDIVRIEQLINNNNSEIARLQSVLAKYKEPDFQLDTLERLLGRTVESQTDTINKNIAAMQEANKELIKQRDEFYNTASQPQITTTEPLDPLIAAYQKAAEHLASVRKEIADGNKDLDDSLAAILYQDAIDNIQNYVNEQESTFTDRNNTVDLLQQDYLTNLANFSTQEQAYREEEIANTKEAVERLAKELEKYKAILKSASSATSGIGNRSAFVPDEKPKKGRTGKTTEQRQAEEAERYVKDLEKQAATLNMTRAEVQQYELAEKNLTGEHLKRAQAALAIVSATEKMAQATANARTNNTMQIDLLRLTGKDLDADLLELENKFKQTTEQLKKDGNEAGIAIAKNLFDAGKAKVQLDAVKNEISKAFTNQNLQEQSIQAQVTAGLITQYQGQKRITELHKQTASIVKSYLPALEKAAQMPGAMGEQAKQYLTDINNQLLVLQTTTSEVQNALRNGLQDGIQSSIEGLRQQTMNLQEAFLNIFESIGSSILNYFVQTLAQNAATEITGALSGLGSFFGLGGMETTETDPQALAISTASQEGALAMQMGIEQGSIVAAQTISAAVSSLGAMQASNEAGLFGNVAQNATEAVTAINTVTAAKTASDATVTASAASAAATTTATNTAAAAASTAAWAPAAATASTASFGSAAAIGLAALMAVMTAVKAFKDGGHVQGAGTGKSDSIPAWLSDDEFVIQSDVVRQPGMLPFLNSLNRNGLAAIPRVKHATGGLAGVPAPNVDVPAYMGVEPAENINNNSATVNNSQSFVFLRDPKEIPNAINSSSGREAIVTVMKENPEEFKSALQLG